MDFIKDNFGYVLGFITAPIVWKFLKVFKRTFKSTIHKKIRPKNNNN